MKPVPTRGSIESFLPLAILLSLVLLGYLTLRPLLPSILWAMTLGVSLAPLHMRLKQRLWGRSSLATAVVTLLMLLFLLLPMIGLSRALIAFVPEIVSWVDGLNLPMPEHASGDAPAKFPLLSDDLAMFWSQVQSDVAAIRLYFGTELRPFAMWALSEGRVLGGFVFEFALGILLAAILIHQQERVGPFVKQLMFRASGPFGRHLTALATSTIRSTFFAVLLAAAAQSVVASVAYVVSGVPHWAILSLLTFLLAMFQVGPPLIWGPIAIWLAIDGQTGLAVFVCAWGLIAVGLTDNFVRTFLVSKASELPGVLAFLGAIGGLLAWGIVGVFLGPVIVALCYKLAIEWVNDPPKATTDPVE